MLSGGIMIILICLTIISGSLSLIYLVYNETKRTKEMSKYMKEEQDFTDKMSKLVEENRNTIEKLRAFALDEQLPIKVSFFISKKRLNYVKPLLN